MTLAADGWERVSDLDVLRDRTELFRPAPSNATVSRFVEHAADQPEEFAHGFATMPRAMRTKVSAASGNRNPGLRASAANPLIIDIDICGSTKVDIGDHREQRRGPRHRRRA